MLSLSIEVDGFRKGHIPENIVIQKVGESRILEEATDILLKEHFPKIIEQEKLDIIGRPKISITKLAIGNPTEFKAIFAVLPTFELPDYRALARSAVALVKVDKNDSGATEKEVEDVLLQIRKNKAHFDYHKDNPEDKEHNHSEIKDEDLPALDDALAKSAGNFENLAELKAKIKENIVKEKELKNADKKRASVLEELHRNVKIDLPEILVESETEKALAQIKDDVARMGGKPRRQGVGEPTEASAWEDYLSYIKKTESDLKKELRESSEKKAKIQLIFNQIAEKEKIEPNKEVLENEVKEVLKHYPEASETSARIYVATVLQNAEIFKILQV